MKSLLLIFLTSLFIIQTAYTQEHDFKAPNYELIKKNIQDSTSNFYYPKLLERMFANDTLLNNDDYLHLYFGYIYQPKYSTFYRSPNEEKLSKYYRSEKIDEKDYDEIIKLAEQSIALFPFDLNHLNFLSYIYELKKDNTKAKNIAIRFESILNAIMSTGNGLECETSFHVILVGHEYVILNILDMKVTSQSLIGYCDYMSIEKGKFAVDGIYFNVEKIFEKNRELFNKKE